MQLRSRFKSQGAVLQGVRTASANALGSNKSSLAEVS